MTRGIERYSTTDTWYKGATHTHSTVSDGAIAPMDMMNMYRAAGYDFIFLTDHNITADVERPGLPLLAMNGIELSEAPGETGYHLLGLGVSKPLSRALTIEQKIEAIHAERGLAVMAHPYWSGNTPEFLARYNIDGIEVYNHAANWLNGKALSSYHWDVLLEKNRNMLGFAGDDAHHQPHEPELWKHGWIMVNAPALQKDDILNSLKNGNFYATQGPEFKSIIIKDNTVHLATSPVKEIRIVGRGSSGKRLVTADPNTVFTGADFTLDGMNGYVRAEIEDINGRRAWTNTLFMDA